MPASYLAGMWSSRWIYGLGFREKDALGWRRRKAVAGVLRAHETGAGTGKGFEAAPLSPETHPAGLTF